MEAYTLNLKLKHIKGVIISYQNSVVFQQKSAQLIFGAIDSKGILPVSIGKLFSVGEGIQIDHINRFSYGIPESVSLNSNKLKKVEAGGIGEAPFDSQQYSC